MCDIKVTVLVISEWSSRVAWFHPANLKLFLSDANSSILSSPTVWSASTLLPVAISLTSLGPSNEWHPILALSLLAYCIQYTGVGKSYSVNRVLNKR